MGMALLSLLQSIHYDLFTCLDYDRLNPKGPSTRLFLRTTPTGWQKKDTENNGSKLLCFCGTQRP